MAPDEKKKGPSQTITSLAKELRELRDEFNALKEQVTNFVTKDNAAKARKPFLKVEEHYGEKVPEQRKETNIKMDDYYKLQSVKNACKILPPNRIVDGRHDLEDVSAICGFKVSDEMLDAVYQET
jgi:hypothetical protein